MKVRAKVLIISPWGKAKPGDDNDGVLDIEDEAVALSLIKQGKAEAVEEPKAEAAEAPKPKRGK